MQRNRFRNSALTLIMCLLVTLAFGTLPAYAENWCKGPKTLTVTAGDAIKQDLSTIDIVVDVYRIADATSNPEFVTYDYELVSPFDTDALAAAMAANEWTELASGATEVVRNALASGGTGTLVHFQGKLGETIDLSSASDEGDGVYLVLPHAATEDVCSLKAQSDTYTYTFSPNIVALPTKDGLSGDGAANSAEGDWVPDAEIVLKASRTQRTKPSGKVPAQPVRTGDDTNLTPFFVAMIVSGGLLVALIAQSIRERKNERKEAQQGQK